MQKELQINDDYRLKNNEKFQQIFFPLNEKTSFKINQRFRELTRNKISNIILNAPWLNYKFLQLIQCCRNLT